MMRPRVSKMPRRHKDSHKGDYGHVLVVAGALGMTGAAYLASQSAIRSGSGLVTLAIPEGLNQIMEIKLTEVMTLPVNQTKDLTISRKAINKIRAFLDKIDVVAMGPGLSRNKETMSLVRGLLLSTKKPVVLDADGINALEGKAGILKRRKADTVITPHPGEMARLIGKDKQYVQKDRENVAKSFSIKYNCVTILKGYRTIVASPDGNVYVNATGNSGMSTAGVGDVLTGMVASLIGQGISGYSASVISVYLHGKAGDIAAWEKSQFGMIASDILDRLPQVFRDA